MATALSSPTVATALLCTEWLRSFKALSCASVAQIGSEPEMSQTLSQPSLPPVDRC